MTAPAKLQQLMDVASAAMQEKEQSWSTTVNRMKLIQLMTPKRVMLLLEALRDARAALEYYDSISLEHTTHCLDSSSGDCICYVSVPRNALAEIDNKLKGIVKP